MPTIQPVYTDAPVVEPVTLGQAAAHLQLDWVVGTEGVLEVDQAEQDNLLLYLQAARSLCEAYTGRLFAGGQTVDYTFRLDETYAVPPGAEVVSVSGFFTSVTDAQAWSFEEYRKGISINRQYPLEWAAQQTYTVRVNLPASVSQACPPLAKAAILELTAELYRNRETSVVGSISQTLPVSFQVKLAPLVATPVLL